MCCPSGGPSSGAMGSTFFIELRHCDHLDSKNIVFGYVVSGMDVVRQIEQVEREARPPDPATTFVVRESDNAVIHPVHPITIVDCGELSPAERTAPVVDPLAAEDPWADYPQDSSCDTPEKLLQAAEQIRCCAKLAEYREEQQLAEDKLSKSLRYIERATRCVGSSPQLIGTLLDRAECRVRMLKHSQALEDCELVLAAEPNQSTALFLLGKCLLEVQGHKGKSTSTCLKRAAAALEKAAEVGCEEQAACAELLKQARQRIKADKKKEKSVYANMFK